MIYTIITKSDIEEISSDESLKNIITTYSLHGEYQYFIIRSYDTYYFVHKFSNTSIFVSKSFTSLSMIIHKHTTQICQFDDQEHTHIRYLLDTADNKEKIEYIFDYLKCRYESIIDRMANIAIETKPISHTKNAN